MNHDALEITPLQSTDSIPYDLLELADPSKEHIDSYLFSGTCYLAKINEKLIGVMVLEEVNANSIEIKNIAISSFHQKMGFGTRLLRYAEEISQKQGYSTLIISTGNSSIHQLLLYQKKGFEINKIKKNYFIQNYHEVIYELSLFTSSFLLK